MIRSLSIAQAFPSRVLEYVGDGPLVMGVDLGTTTNKKSNPTAIALVEKVGVESVVRLAARWKTDKPDVTKGILLLLCAELVRMKKRLRLLNMDSSNERFFAADCAKALSGLVSVRLSVLGTRVDYRGQPMTLKARACGRLEAAAVDNRLRLPAAPWIEKDLRQMVKEGAAYNAEVDADGAHADFFIALALAMDAEESSGPAEAQAASITEAGKRPKGVKRSEWEDTNQEDDQGLNA